MANVKFVNAAGKYQDDTARHDVIHYLTQRRKIPNHIVGSSHGDIAQAADRMTRNARSFGKDQGVRIYHFIITFAAGDIRGLEYILYAADEITRIIGQRYEIVYAVHEDTRIPHIHFAFNPVSFVDGYKYHGGKEEFRELMEKLTKVMNFVGVYRFFRVKYVPNGEEPHE